MRKLSFAILTGGLLLSMPVQLPSAVAQGGGPPGQGTGASSLGALKGTYVFLLRGFNGSIDAASAGTFIADGNGTITSGSLDTNSGTGSVSTASFTGTYASTAFNQLTLTLSASGQTITLPVFLGSFNSSSVASKLRTEATVNGITEAGVLYLQDSSIATQGTFNTGSFAMGLSGGISSNRATVVGRFDAVSGGSIANGELDSFVGNGSTGTALAAQTFSGSYTASATKAPATLSVGNLTLHYNLYPVSNDQLLLLETDAPSSGYPVTAGMALRQVATSSTASSTYGFTNASVTGTSVYSFDGLSANGATLSSVGLLKTSGSGSLTLTGVVNNAGTSNALSTSANYSVADNGRFSVTSTALPSIVGYVTSSGDAFFASSDASLSLGFFEPQTATSITTQSLTAGAFLLGSQAPRTTSTPLDAGLVTLDGNGSVTALALNDSTQGTIASSGSTLGSYTIDSTGYVSSSFAGLTGYLVSASRFVALTSGGQYGVPFEFDYSSGSMMGGSPPTSTATTTSLTASTTTATVGTSVMFTATVSDSAATGTVTFYDGTTSLGTGSLSSGVASLSTSSLATGSHSITAVYGGDSTYGGSTSSAVTVTINAASSTTSTTTLTSTSTTPTYGTSITLTATVSPTAATGSVTFYDGSTSLGQVALSSGAASLATSALAVGTHTLAATYAGDSTYSGSTSSSITVTVSSSSSTDCSSYTGTPLIVCLANVYYGTLSTSQQSATLYSYTLANAEIWSNLPTAMVSRNGLKFGDLTTAQQNAALALIQAVLSSEGYTRFQSLRIADDYLAANGGGTSTYGAGRYFIAFLGTPSTTSAWQLQVGGHHYALNTTYNGNYVSATPFFLGVEPPSFTVSGTTYTVMEKQRAAAYALGQTLTSNSSAKLSGTFDDVVHGANGSTSHDDNYPQAYPTTGRGVLYSSLSSTQQALIKSYIEAWVNDQNSTIASSLLSVYEDSTALASTYVGYSGTGAFTTQGDYIRVDGPRVWIEFVVQNGIVFQNGIHYHSIWRDKTADYGGDF